MKQQDSNLLQHLLMVSCLFYCTLFIHINSGIQLYLAKQLEIIQDFAMVYSSQFNNDDDNDDNIIDALWCQSANNSFNIGLWYYPNGTQVPLISGNFYNSSSSSPLISKRFRGQIAIAINRGLSGYEGLYTCIIPDEIGVNQTLVVGIYRNITYNSNGQKET